MITRLNDQNFESFIADGGKTLILVDFWSPRCESCRYNAPVADEISRELREKIKVGKVNVEECPYTVGNHNIRIVPSMVLFLNGKAVHTFNGVVSKDTVKARLGKKNL